MTGTPHQSQICATRFSELRLCQATSSLFAAPRQIAGSARAPAVTRRQARGTAAKKNGSIFWPRMSCWVIPSFLKARWLCLDILLFCARRLFVEPPRTQVRSAFLGSKADTNDTQSQSTLADSAVPLLTSSLTFLTAKQRIIGASWSGFPQPKTHLQV